MKISKKYSFKQILTIIKEWSVNFVKNHFHQNLI